jgi:hypothetical protein
MVKERMIAHERLIRSLASRQAAPEISPDESHEKYGLKC